MPKFLIIRLSSIGDIVLTTPVIRCLKQQVANAEIHFLTKKSYQEIIEHNPFIDKKIFLDDRLNETINKLKDENYDYIIDLHNNIRTFFIKLRLNKKSFSFNKLNFEKWLLVNFKVNRLPQKHIVDRYMETVEGYFAIKNDGKGLDYFLPVKTNKEITPALPQKYLAFIIGAKHGTKKIPVAKIISICKKINCQIVLIGGKEDEGTAKLITESLTENILNFCGKLSINESAFVIKNASVVITHDTGMMHIAAAFKKKIISVWGNTIPEFGMTPYYGNNQIQNYKSQVLGLNCRPCSKIGYDKCPQGHFKCMINIDETAIEREVNNLL